VSNKSQLQTNNTALDSLITRVNAAKDVAASLPEAGGELVTKTVDVSVYRGSLSWCTYTKLDTNGNMVAVYQALSGTDVSIAGCVVGTTFTLSYSAMEFTDASNTSEVYSEDQVLYVGTVI
jgi:hypothetical protein